MKKLYRLYIALAAVVVLTTAFGLVVQRNLMSAYSASAVANNRFISHKAAYEHLQQLAAAGEAAANLVFQNGELEEQSRQMTTAFDEFNRLILRERDQIIKT